MRELPRQLSVDELAELFEGLTPLVQRLAHVEDPLSAADRIIAELSEDELREALDAHPAIGAKNLSARSAAEQGTDDDVELIVELEIELGHGHYHVPLLVSSYACASYRGS